MLRDVALPTIDACGYQTQRQLKGALRVPGQGRLWVAVKKRKRHGNDGDDGGGDGGTEMENIYHRCEEDDAGSEPRQQQQQERFVIKEMVAHRGSRSSSAPTWLFSDGRERMLLANAAKRLRHTLVEASALADLGEHPNVVPLSQVLCSKPPGDSSSGGVGDGFWCALAAPFADHGDMIDFLDKLGAPFEWPPERSFAAFVQIVEGVRHLHRNGICHRDLKLDNILVFPSENGWRFRITDLDLCGRPGRSRRNLIARVGSAPTRAPEVWALSNSACPLARNNNHRGGICDRLSNDLSDSEEEEDKDGGGTSLNRYSALLGVPGGSDLLDFCRSNAGKQLLSDPSSSSNASSSHYNTTSYAGNARTISGLGSPGSLNACRADHGYDGFRADLWSLGVIAVTMATRADLHILARHSGAKLRLARADKSCAAFVELAASQERLEQQQLPLRSSSEAHAASPTPERDRAGDETLPPPIAWCTRYGCVFWAQRAARTLLRVRPSERPPDALAIDCGSFRSPPPCPFAGRPAAAVSAAAGSSPLASLGHSLGGVGFGIAAEAALGAPPLRMPAAVPSPSAATTTSLPSVSL